MASSVQNGAPQELFLNKSGSVAIIFALSTMVIFAAIGGAIDFQRWHSAQNQVANALDSAVLASVRVLQLKGSADETAALNAARKYFDAHKPDWIENSATTFRVTNSGSVVEGTTRTALSTPFLSVIGIQSLDISTKAAAVLATQAKTKTEISLMLDVTGSMGFSSSMRALREAAADLVNIVLWGNAGQSSTRVALVPFSASVKVGEYADDLLLLPDSGAQGQILVKCVLDRKASSIDTDDPPKIYNHDAFLPYGVKPEEGDENPKSADQVRRHSYRTRPNHAKECRPRDPDEGNPNPTVAMVPLTNDKAKLLESIEKLKSRGQTAGALATSFAWYLLSPKFGDIWENHQADSRPAAYGLINEITTDGEPKLRKIAILMTDGEYNTRDGVTKDGRSQRDQDFRKEVSDDAISICSSMKDEGIKVFTVLFKSTSDLAIKTMKACASREVNDPADSPSYFFQASDAGGLRSAFRSIAVSIASVRLKS